MKELIEDIANENGYEYDEIHTFEEDGIELYKVYRRVEDEKYGFEVSSELPESIRSRQIELLFQRMEEGIEQ